MKTFFYSRHNNFFNCVRESSISYIALFFYIMTCLSCHHGMVPQSSKSVSLEVPDANGHLQLLGIATRSRLEQAPFGDWFNKNYAAYVVDTAMIERLRTGLAGKRLLIFMGTWCGDSQREVPRFFKILQCCGVDTASVEMVTVSDRDSLYKQSPGHEEKGRDIFRVPDFIVLDKGREVGRIVESPVASLEKDLQSIVSGEPYVAKYPGGAFLAGLFRKEKVSRMRKRLPELTEKLRPMVRKSGELSSYAKVLDAAGQPDKASFVRELKTRLFPGG